MDKRRYHELQDMLKSQIKDGFTRPELAYLLELAFREKERLITTKAKDGCHYPERVSTIQEILRKLEKEILR